MANSIGTIFKVSTWGESHGPALGAVIDGCPANLPITTENIADQLARDVPDKALGTPRGEKNRFQILSGIFEGLTLGTPISIIIWNNDSNPASYSSTRETFRPGHADYTYFVKYRHTDWRGGSRASGRECIARLAAGAIALKLVQTAGVFFDGRIIELAGIAIKDAASAKSAREKALGLGKDGETTGGIVEISIRGLPPGIGQPVFNKLEADLGRAFLTIGGVKGFETGLGFQAARETGSSHNDPFKFDRKKKVILASNKCGGILGGISTGTDLVFRLAVKPTPTVAIPQKTVDIAAKKEITMEYSGRFDKNFTPRIIPIAEAMAAIVIADHLLMSGVINPCHL